MMGRIPILDVTPSEGCGQWPAKAVVGETFSVSATVFREGHDAVSANVVLRDPKGTKGPLIPMRPGAPGTDRWSAEVTPTSCGRWSFAVEAWSDPFATWHHNAEVKIAAGVDVDLMLEEGARVARLVRLSDCYQAMARCFSAGPASDMWMLKEPHSLDTGSLRVQAFDFRCDKGL